MLFSFRFANNIYIYMDIKKADRCTITISNRRATFLLINCRLSITKRNFKGIVTPSQFTQCQNVTTVQWALNKMFILHTWIYETCAFAHIVISITNIQSDTLWVFYQWKCSHEWPVVAALWYSEQSVPKFINFHCIWLHFGQCSCVKQRFLNEQR